MSMVLLTISAYTQEYTGTLRPKQDKSAGKWGYIDKAGKEITPIKYDADTFSEGLARVISWTLLYVINFSSLKSFGLLHLRNY